MDEIVKVCKIHGQLNSGNIRLKKHKSNGKMYSLCKLCAKDWYLNNIEKRRAQGRKTQENKKKFIEKHKYEGKICKIHGILTVEDINSYGYCKFCRRISIKKSSLKYKDKIDIWRKNHYEKQENRDRRQKTDLKRQAKNGCAPYIPFLEQQEFIYCNICEKDLKYDQFNRFSFKRRYPCCIKCRHTNKIPYYKHGDKKNKIRSLATKFGLTIKNYNDLLKIQNNSCAICKRTEISITAKNDNFKKLTVDHSHQEEKIGIMKIRGLLCQTCNFGLGSFRDDKNILMAAIEYLNKEPAFIRKMRPKQKSSISERKPIGYAKNLLDRMEKNEKIRQDLLTQEQN